MEHICEESAAGWAGSLSLRRETSGAWRSAEQLAIRRPVLSVWKRVDEWIDDTRSPGQDGSHHVNDGHFCLFLLFENLKKAIDHNQFEREWWGCCTRIRDYISHYEWKKKTSTNLIISYVDHHQRQETEEEAAKDDEHHAGKSQVIASLMFLWRTLFAALIFHWLDHRKVGFFLSGVSTRSGAVNLIKINFFKFKLQTFFFYHFKKI